MRNARKALHHGDGEAATSSLALLRIMQISLFLFCSITDCWHGIHSPPPPPPPLPMMVESLDDLCTLLGPTRSISSLEYSPNGQFLAAASSDCSIYVYDTANETFPSSMSLNPHLRLEGHTRGVSDVAWSPDSHFLASASDDLTISIWRPTEPDQESTSASAVTSRAILKGHTNYVFCMSWGPTGGILASGSFDESVRLWNMSQPGVCLRTMQAHADPVTGVSFSPDGTLLASSSYDGLIRLWDVRSGRCVKTIVDDDNPPVSSVCFSLNGKYLLAATLDDTVRLWSVHSGKCVKSYSGHVNRKYCIPPLFVVGREPGTTSRSDDNDGNTSVSGTPSVRIAMGSEDGNLFMWDLNSREVLLKRTIFTGEPLLALAINPIRSELAAAPLSVTGTDDGENKIKIFSYK